MKKKNPKISVVSHAQTSHFFKSFFSILLFFSMTLASYAQIGEVLWEDNFDAFNTEYWTKDIGDGCDQGICGWGNQELQSYQSENVYVQNIPGEPGNRALVLEAKRQNAGNSAFTSGKVISRNKVAVHYGLVEVRIRVPNLQQGLWPAAWMLGTTNLAWPAKGEIDIMEMGFQKAERDRQQEPNSTVNNFVGANAFFAIPDNGGVGNIAFDVDYATPYVAPTPINDRFLTYRIYWEPTKIRFTVIDNGAEKDLYAAPFEINPDNVTAPFTRPFYMLLNLAVGGTLPGTPNPGSVTAPLPGKMYVDYVKVSKWNGHGSVEFSDGNLPAESGPFGVFTENTPVNSQLNFGADSEIYVFGDTLTEGNEPPVEGNEVISWRAKGGTWFGGGITSLFGKNMSGYKDKGKMKFRIKIPGDVSFRIGITDNFTNEQYINFPAGQTKYGLVRNGQWGQVEIPLKDFEGLVAFQNLGYMFIIGSDPAAFPARDFSFAIDDIYWTDGNGGVACQPTSINANATVNGAATNQTTLSLDAGGTVILRPTAGQGGSWRWVGPNGFSSTNRQITLNNIQTNNAGNYTVLYTNNCGKESTLVYSISVGTVTPPPPGEITTWTSNNISGHIIRHRNSRGRIDQNVTPEEAGQWRMVPGLAGRGVSFQSVNFPNRYLRHRNSQVWLDPYQESNLYKADASFIEVPGLADASQTSFQSVNFPNRYLRHRGFLLYVESVNSDLGRRDATFSKNGSGGGGNPTFSQQIEAENFVAANQVQIEDASEGGQNVGYLANGSWMVYDVNLPVDGAYTIDYRVASAVGGGVIQLEKAGGAPVYGTINVPNTGGWQNWQTITHSVNLTAGEQQIAIFVPTAGYNINWLKISSGTNKSSGFEAISQKLLGYPNPASDVLTVSGLTPGNVYTVVDISGRVILKATADSDTNEEVDVNSLNQGIYLLKEGSTGKILKFSK